MTDGSVKKEYTSKSKLFCSVYKSAKKHEMYLYVDRKEGIKSLPDELKAIFGTASHVLDLVLTPEKTLARVDAKKVLNGIAENGYYLQMPPGKEDYMLELYKPPKDSLHG